VKKKRPRKEAMATVIKKMILEKSPSGRGGEKGALLEPMKKKKKKIEKPDCNQSKEQITNETLRCVAEKNNRGKKKKRKKKKKP